MCIPFLKYLSSIPGSKDSKGFDDSHRANGTKPVLASKLKNYLTPCFHESSHSLARLPWWSSSLIGDSTFGISLPMRGLHAQLWTSLGKIIRWTMASLWAFLLLIDFLWQFQLSVQFCKHQGVQKNFPFLMWLRMYLHLLRLPPSTRRVPKASQSIHFTEFLKYYGLMQALWNF